MFLGHKKIESYHEMVKRVPHNSIRALIPIKMTNFFNTKIPLNFWTQTYFDVGLQSLSLAYPFFYSGLYCTASRNQHTFRICVP